MAKRNEPYTVIWHDYEEGQTVVDWCRTSSAETAIKHVEHERNETLIDPVVFTGHITPEN